MDIGLDAKNGPWPRQTWRTAVRGLFVVVVATSGACNGHSDCTTLGEVYSAHDRNAGCCPGLINYGLEFEPSDTYEGDDLPEGCGVNDAPESIMVCIACGDGVCGEAEHFCNCPEDCPRD